MENMTKMTDRQKKEMLDVDYEIVEDDKPEKCIDCPLNRVCPKAFEMKGVSTRKKQQNVECYYELKGLYREKRDLFVKWQSFVDLDPKYFMEKMMINYSLLENEALQDFSFAKGMQLQYLLMSIYKMRFGEKKQIESNSTNASIDIKAIMNKTRDGEEKK